ncbi:hypothetical protein AAT19DRAFT_10348 [Rhodotorula toruloides]|uniref:Ribosomal protein L29 n=2 Tax=Rhodotorula toruloides TaxID=5286 RepID=A0A2T0A0E9_RHOTO|nr:hypothetical protein AAT19DRAFT_10348 [Rhodotorula toruloides]
MSSSLKVRASELQSKKRDELLKQLEELKTELVSLRVQKVTGGNASKLAKMWVSKGSFGAGAGFSGCWNGLDGRARALGGGEMGMSGPGGRYRAQRVDRRQCGFRSPMNPRARLCRPRTQHSCRQNVVSSVRSDSTPTCTLAPFPRPLAPRLSPPGGLLRSHG